MANRGINKVILIGYIGQEPEVRYMSNGNMVTNINLATTESWKDKQTSDLKEKTEWHRIVFFGKLAEISAEYLHKGYQIYVEGSLHTRKWQNQDGKDQYITEVIVGIGGVMQMLNNRRIEESDKLSVDNVEDNNNTKKSSSSIKIKDSDIDFNEEDIPF